MRWRGWKASAPSGGSGLSGSPRELGLALGVFISTKGKSAIGPDQVSSVLSNAEKWRAAGSCGNGMRTKTKCHKAAARRARRGTRRSTQHSLKNPDPASRKFFGTRVQVRTARRLLPMPWWKEPQATSSFGPTPLSRRTGAAGFVACPKRSNALLTWLKKFPFRMLVADASSLVERSARVS